MTKDAQTDARAGKERQSVGTQMAPGILIVCAHTREHMCTLLHNSRPLGSEEYARSECLCKASGNSVQRICYSVHST